jgi:excisionase family DNA binding protein
MQNAHGEKPYTVPGAAEALNVSVHTIRTWVSKRRIGYHRLGRSIRISRDEVARMLDSGYVPPMEGR